MRILVTFAGGTGHVLPLLPFAHALFARGHDVLITGQDAMRPVVEDAGFVFAPSGGPTLTDPAVRGELMATNRPGVDTVLGEGFAGRTARDRVPHLLALISEFDAELILRDEVDFGAVIAAELANIPHVAVVVTAAGQVLRPEIIAPHLDAVRTTHGLPPDPHLLQLHRHLTLTPVPPSFRDPTHPLPATAIAVQPAILTPTATPSGVSGAGMVTVLRWLAQRQDNPTVHITLGTVFHQESGDLFPRMLTALADSAVNVVMTVGREIDPTELGATPTNIHIARYLPQTQLLPHCHAVICHGGSGTVINTLTLGIPLVLLPLGADQPDNAERCHHLGAGIMLNPRTSTPTDISTAVEQVLNTPTYRHAAQLLRNEALTLPTVADTCTLIEHLH